MTGGSSGAVPVRSWQASAEGCTTSALLSPCHRIRLDEAKGWLRAAARRGTSEVETLETTREVMARSTVGRWPNPALQRIAARWRLCQSRTDTSGPLALMAGVRPG